MLQGVLDLVEQHELSNSGGYGFRDYIRGV